VLALTPEATRSTVGAVTVPPTDILAVFAEATEVTTEDVSIARVTEPEVPPPVKPVPAVTPVISPTSFAIHLRPVV
jgi:hypothetical protein